MVRFVNLSKSKGLFGLVNVLKQISFFPGDAMHAIEERERITARVSQTNAEKLQQAADLSGATLNQFLVQAALEKAQKIIDREK